MPNSTTFWNVLNVTDLEWSATNRRIHIQELGCEAEMVWYSMTYGVLKEHAQWDLGNISFLGRDVRLGEGIGEKEKSLWKDCLKGANTVFDHPVSLRCDLS